MMAQTAAVMVTMAALRKILAATMLMAARTEYDMAMMVAVGNAAMMTPVFRQHRRRHPSALRIFGPNSF